MKTSHERQTKLCSVGVEKERMTEKVKQEQTQADGVSIWMGKRGFSGPWRKAQSISKYCGTTGQRFEKH